MINYTYLGKLWKHNILSFNIKAIGDENMVIIYNPTHIIKDLYYLPLGNEKNIRLAFNFSCRHGDNGCCVHCSPLEPYDEEYLKTQNMKHLSFHSYLRKMTAGMAKCVNQFYVNDKNNLIKYYLFQRKIFTTRKH